MKTPLRMVALGLGMLGVGMGWSYQASAVPVYIGLQEASVNGGAITNESGAGGGTNSSTFSGAYGTFTVNTVTGTALGEPALDSTSTNASSSAAGVLNVFVSETNNFPSAPVSTFLSTFTTNELNGAITSVKESTYAVPCAASPCTATDAFNINAADLLSTTTFTTAGPDVFGTSPPPAGLTTPYSVIEVYTITATGVGNDNSTIDISATPLPSTWTMLIASLLGLGLFAYRGSKNRRQGISMLGATAA